MRAPQKFKSWLFPILVKAHINDFHWQSREALFVDVELSDVALDQLGSDWIQTPDERFFDQVLDSEVQQALDALPVKFRAVVWLFDAEELS